MFCPACGAETKEGLRYCNRCGASLIAERTAPPRLFTMIVILSVVVLLVIIISFTIIFFFGIELAGRGNVDPFAFLFLITLSLVALTMVWLIVRQLARLISVYLETSETKEQPKTGMTAANSGAGNQFSNYQTTPNLPPASTVPIDAEQMTRKLGTEE
ncbi:MAG: zinc ribbon domain-containing protein [Acidobacteriota bacterium]|nr:zinc ribbon domain-containing protein [Acidobacteriota bacterium]